MSETQLRALRVLSKGPIDDWVRTVYGIRERTLSALVKAGLVEFLPDKKLWRITKAGREKLKV